MINTVKSGYIYITFDNDDWKNRVAERIILEFNRYSLKNPTGFNYNGETKQWYFKDCQEIRDFIERLKEKYYVDKKHSSL